MDNINDVFGEYQGIYKKILGSFYPAKNSTGFQERNLSVNLSKAYEKVAEKYKLVRTAIWGAE